MTSAVFAGSFDPVSIGHAEIVRRLSHIFDRVYFLLAINAEKTAFFTVEERLEMMRLAVTGLQNVVVDYTPGYVYRYAQEHGAAVLARGVRNAEDYAYERIMAENNRGWAPKLETVYLMCDPAYAEVSSSAIRAALREGGDLTPYLGESVAAYLASIPDFEQRRREIGKQ